MRRVAVVLALAALLVGTVAVSAAAGNPFADEASTAAGYATWDSDMVDIEQVTQTGAGVYVAVIDTGLAPNWRDYWKASWGKTPDIDALLDELDREGW